MVESYGKTKTGSERKRPARKGEGRPSTYDEKIADRICKELTEGRSLKRLIEEEKDIPAMSTIFEWIWRNPEFSEKYTKARKVQAEGFIDEIMDISDGTCIKGGSDVQRARLMVDTRKWYASKVIPKVYGDRLQLEDDRVKEPVEVNINLSKE